jgi:hypothetical protein
MDTHFPKLTITESKPKNAYEESLPLPPRRGRIQREIFRELAVTIRYLLGGFARNQPESGGFLNSNSTITESKPKNTYEESLPSPPRRGRIKREIFRGLAVTIWYLLGGFGRNQP